MYGHGDRTPRKWILLVLTTNWHRRKSQLPLKKILGITNILDYEKNKTSSEDMLK